ncbi:MAG: 50S ribosomal protein L21 [Spirochaetes bacterium]|nr:MAG: 50S ribosomal protein L21 [Spirochaetota bacterium]
MGPHRDFLIIGKSSSGEATPRNVIEKVEAMYAIVEIGGKQYKVEKDMTLDVDKVPAGAADGMKLDRVLMLVDGEKVMIGTPYLNNVKITAAVLGMHKGEKVRGVKFKKRKNYTRTLGHRRQLLQLKIQEVALQ